MKYSYYVVVEVIANVGEDGIGDFVRVCTEIILSEPIKSMNEIDAIKKVFADEYKSELEDVQITFYNLLRGIPEKDDKDKKGIIDKFIGE